MRAAVIGANGAIGHAMVEHLAADPSFEIIYAFSRRLRDWPASSVQARALDLDDAASISAAADSIAAPLDLVLIAIGLLHEGGRGPERALRQIDPDWMARSFTVNTIGPALLLQRFVPLLQRDGRSVLAALSARVGSISDNRLGGWYSYRASKAALNMVVRCAAIEIARTRPEAICVTLHPGTVDSPLSQPFQSAIPEGKLFSPSQAAKQLMNVIAGLSPIDSGRCFAWDGSAIEP